MKKLYFALCMLFSITCIFAQQELKGIILDNISNANIEFATLVLSSDSHRPIVSYSNDKGEFELKNIIKGQYLLKVSVVGYQPVVKNIMVADSVLNPISIRMSIDGQTLSAVTVTAQKKMFEQKVDRLVFNVENSTLHQGNSVWETLSKMPGVRINSEEQISVSGKGVLILINDRPKQLSPEQIAEILRSMSSDELAKIEIIHNPPAKYDAQGGAIIHLITKKNTNEGWNAQARFIYTQATYPKYTGMGGFSWKNKKWSFNTTYAYKDRKDLIKEEEDISFLNSQWIGSKKKLSNSQVHTLRSSLDYLISSKQSMGIVIDNLFRQGQLNGISNTQAVTLKSLDSLMNTNYNGKSEQQHTLVGVYYKIQLDTSGQVLTFDLDYSPFKDKRERAVLNTTLLANNMLSNNVFDTKQNPEQYSNIASFKSDYHLPLTKVGVNFDAGIKLNSIVVDNELSFLNRVDGKYESNVLLSNIYKYKEQVFASYINFSGTIKSWSYQIGLRGENTTINANRNNSLTPTKTQYFKIFPSVYLNKNYGDNHQINMYWGRRIVRPEFWRLNSFRSYNSPFNYTEGNPLLKPEYPQSIELKYTFQQQLSLAFVTNFTKDFINNVRIQNNKEYVFINTYRNLGNSIELGANLNYNFQISPSIQNNSTVQLMKKQDKLVWEGENVKNNVLNFYVASYTSFIFSKDKTLRGDINMWYGSSSIQGINQLGENGEISFGIKKFLFKNKAMFALNINDILYTNVNKIKINYKDQKSNFIEKNDTRTFTLSFGYRFGNTKMKETKQRKTASEDDKKRLFE